MTDKLFKAEIAKEKEFMIYQFLEQFGDRISDDVKNDMMMEAEHQKQIKMIYSLY